MIEITRNIIERFYDINIYQINTYNSNIPMVEYTVRITPREEGSYIPFIRPNNVNDIFSEVSVKTFPVNLPLIGMSMEVKNKNYTHRVEKTRMVTKQELIYDFGKMVRKEKPPYNKITNSYEEKYYINELYYEIDEVKNEIEYMITDFLYRSKDIDFTKSAKEFITETVIRKIMRNEVRK